tara:strand:+ start:137 stop:958 length:822 start_codon:yes stop_codon:yes gene_type:complete
MHIERKDKNMAQFPAIPIWTDAYLADTRHLTTIEHGAYLLLLIIAWRSPDCDLPDDDKILARYAGLTKGQWMRIKPTIMAAWNLENGRWTQKRLQKELAFVKQKSSSNKRNADARWLKTKETTNAPAMPSQCQVDAPTPTPTPTPKSNSDSAPKAAPKRGSRIADDWTLNESNIQHAKEKGYSDAEIRSVGQEFYDYWTAATGRNATARDWNAKWRTWVSNDIKFNGTPEQRKINDRNKQGNQGVIETGIKVAAQLRDDDRGMSEFLRDFIDS